MVFSWVPGWLNHIEETYNLTNEYFQNIVLTGSSALVYLVCNHPFFSNDIEQYLKELGYSETIRPKDVDILTIQRTDIVQTKIGLYHSSIDPRSHKTYIHNNGSQFVDIMTCRITTYILVNNLKIIIPSKLLSWYEDEMRTNDVLKIKFLEQYNKLFNHEGIVINFSVRPPFDNSSISFII